MPTISAKDGTDLYFKDWGVGDPVVFIHGWPLNADMWEYQMTPIAQQGFRCVGADRRGFGRSGQPWQGYDYDTLADDLAALLENLNLSNVTLVGFSMGGGEVARYMSRHEGRRIARAILVSAVTPFLLKTPDNPDGVAIDVFKDMVEGLHGDRPAFLADFGKKFFGVGVLNFSISTEMLDWAQSLALQASPAATIACVKAFSETDFRSDMGAFTVPTLIIHGDADQTVPIDASARRAAKSIRGARLVEYSGAPHGLFHTEKKRLNDDIVAFMRER
jgi:non-heme chloroperoxidase